MDTNVDVGAFTGRYGDDRLGADVLDFANIFNDELHIIVLEELSCQRLQDRRAGVVGPDSQGSRRLHW